MTRKNTTIALVAVGIIVVVIVALLIKKDIPTNDNTNMASASIAESLKDEYGYVPGVMVNQSFGTSDSYYQGEEGKDVIINIGNGEYNITDDIVKWSFGTPVISMKKAAEITGLTFTKEKPKEYMAPSYYEVYAPDEDVDLSKRTAYFLVDSDGNYLMYKGGSSYVFDKNGIMYAMSYFPEVNPEDENDILVSVTGLPYLKDGKITGLGLASFEYKENKTIISLSEQQQPQIATSSTAPGKNQTE